MKTIKHRLSLNNSLAVLLVVLLMFSNSGITAYAQALCIPPNDVVAGEPTVDGTIFADTVHPADDKGWDGATRFNLNTGTGTSRTGFFQAIKGANHLHLGFLIDSSPCADKDDTIVIVLSPNDGNTAHDWRMHIKPFDISFNAGGMCGTTSDATKLSPDVVSIWRNSDPTAGGPGWNFKEVSMTPNPGPFSPTANFIANGFIAKTTKVNTKWAIEIRIPTTSNSALASSNDRVFLPAGGQFKMYVDVLRTATLLPLGNTVTQSPWPAAEPIVAPDLSRGNPSIENWTPESSHWGITSLDNSAPCRGVSIVESNIGVQSPPAPSQQTMQRFIFASEPGSLPVCSMENAVTPVGKPNTFFAMPFNDSTSDATDVKATFNLGQWGIPGPDDWIRIGSSQLPAANLTGTNPTAPQPIPAASPAAYTLGWDLTKQESCNVASNNYGHHCLWVELDSATSTVPFLISGVRRNMDFEHASSFSDTARIGTKGYPAPPAGRPNQEFLIMVNHDVRNYTRNGDNYTYTPAPPLPGRGRIAGGRDNQGQGAPPSNHFPDEFDTIPAKFYPKGLTQAMVWVARAYRLAGNSLMISSRTYKVVDAVGGFGYVVGHDGAVQNWTQKLTGAGLQQLGGDNYSIQIPPGNAATVNVAIEAIPATASGGGVTYPFSIGLRLGAGFPHGNFNTLYDPGISFAADLEYMINNTFAVAGIFQYNRFRSSLFSNADLNIFQLSGNGKVYLGTGQTRPFFNFGGGVYKIDPGSTRAGLNVGTGLQFNLTNKVALEAHYNYHTIFTSGSNLNFSSLQGGVRFRF